MNKCFTIFPLLSLFKPYEVIELSEITTQDFGIISFKHLCSDEAALDYKIVCESQSSIYLEINSSYDTYQSVLFVNNEIYHACVIREYELAIECVQIPLGSKVRIENHPITS